MSIDAREHGHRVKRMFDSIAPTYDLLNHLLSFGLDFWWRGKAVRTLGEKRGGQFLDIATGTGDLARASLRTDPRHVVGIDFAFRTLLVAGTKITGDAGRIDLVSGDAGLLPFRQNSFDAVTVGFGVRNFPDVLLALREMYRVLRPDGLLCILELSRPHTPGFSQLFHIYFHHIVPFLGGLVSGSNSAYRYLPDSVDAFPEPEAFVALMDAAGFHHTRFSPLTLGTATLYTGKR